MTRNDEDKSKMPSSLEKQHLNRKNTTVNGRMEIKKESRKEFYLSHTLWPTPLSTVDLSPSYRRLQCVLVSRMPSASVCSSNLCARVFDFLVGARNGKDSFTKLTPQPPPLAFRVLYGESKGFDNRLIASGTERHLWSP
ncbi:hypothetical protein CDAR_401241 [Caerostris darwini]|uniref:Uncharacterized protein n=1 Tax=Caerostris darwini TaxID=1538125 RepID=A0AAV4RRU0_9ARAC|nr:hypothetical protein CDAR_401241 [Caerostris darwini]